jgi:hypothetical protein
MVEQGARGSVYGDVLYGVSGHQEQQLQRYKQKLPEAGCCEKYVNDRCCMPGSSLKILKVAR